MEPTRELASASENAGARLPGAVVLLLALSLLVRLGAGFLSPRYQFPDEFLYHELAQNVVQHNTYAYSEPKSGLFPIRQAPGLPITLGLIGKVAPLSPPVVKAINACAGWLAVAALTVLLWRLTARPLLVGAFVLLAGFHPPLVFASATNYPQSFQGLLAALLLLSLVRRQADPDAWRAGLLPGVWIGLGALFVPTQIFLVPAVWLARVAVLRTQVVRFTLGLVVGIILPVAPWAIRNALVEHAFIPFSTSGGEQFALGFNDQAGMNTGVQLGLPEPVQARIEQARSGHEVESICREAGLAWVRAQPERAARLWVLKFLNFFRWDTGALVTVAEQGGGLRTWLTRAASLAVLLVCLAGAPALWRRQRGMALFVAVGLLALAAGHAFFLSRYRYRLPFEPLLLALGLWGWSLRHPLPDRATGPK